MRTHYYYAVHTFYNKHNHIMIYEPIPLSEYDYFTLFTLVKRLINFASRTYLAPSSRANDHMFSERGPESFFFFNKWTRTVDFSAKFRKWLMRNNEYSDRTHSSPYTVRMKQNIFVFSICKFH